MDKKSNKNNIVAWLAKPWLTESVVFFLTLWQETFRLAARTAHRVLPVSSTIQHFYYYNFGDFVNGYIMAFIIDGLINLALFKKTDIYQTARFRVSKRKTALFASLVSAGVVVVFELGQSGSTTSDVNDIPAGVAGAFLYYLVRILALKLVSKYINQKTGTDVK